MFFQSGGWCISGLCTEADRKGIDFQVNVQVSWNAPAAFVTLDSPGVFVFDTAYVPDVLALRTQYPDAAPMKVL